MWFFGLFGKSETQGALRVKRLHWRNWLIDWSSPLLPGCPFFVISRASLLICSVLSSGIMDCGPSACGLCFFFFSSVLILFWIFCLFGLLADISLALLSFFSECYHKKNMIWLQLFDRLWHDYKWYIAPLYHSTIIIIIKRFTFVNKTHDKKVDKL